MLRVLDPDTVALLTETGVPHAVEPLFFPTDPPLRRFGRTAQEAYVQFGGDGETALVIDPPTGQVRSVSPDSTLTDRYVNVSLRAFVMTLADVTTTRRRFADLDDAEIDHELATLAARLVERDASALADGDHWWAVIIEELRDGLL